MEKVDTFIELIKDQFTYGGKKYALDATRESTDVLFDKHGKNWLFGTIDKYTFRFRNLKRERDLLKIATYMYILWLKRGFHIMKEGINDPAIDTNIQNKTDNFSDFIEKIKKFHPEFAKVRMNMTEEHTLYRISEMLQGFSVSEWKKINDYELFMIVSYAYVIWEKKFGNVKKHDTDTYGNDQKIK